MFSTIIAARAVLRDSRGREVGELAMDTWRQFTSLYGEEDETSDSEDGAEPRIESDVDKDGEGGKGERERSKVHAGGGDKDIVIDDDDDGDDGDRSESKDKIDGEAQYHGLESEGTKPMPCDIVAISRGFAFTEPMPFEEEVYTFYNVLWVKWEDGIAYRRGIGRVSKDAWEELPKEDINLVLG